MLFARWGLTEWFCHLKSKCCRIAAMRCSGKLRAGETERERGHSKCGHSEGRRGEALYRCVDHTTLPFMYSLIAVDRCLMRAVVAFSLVMIDVTVWGQLGLRASAVERTPHYECRAYRFQ